MELQEVINLVKIKFQHQVDTSDWEEHLSTKNLFKAEYQNNYVLIFELQNTNIFGISFFKSDSIHEKIFDDYLYVGITFYPKTIEEAKTIFNTIYA